jgi:hypothetical protein
MAAPQSLLRKTTRIGLTMSNIDRQRVAAVRKLEEMGYTFASGDWTKPANDVIAPAIADDLHALLVKRADELAGCTGGSSAEGELEAITDAIEAYEAVRWPSGRVAGGKG